MLLVTESESKDSQPRSAVAPACAILGLLLQGLSLIILHAPFEFIDNATSQAWCFNLGMASLVLVIIALWRGRASLAAKIFGGVGLVGWVVLAYVFFLEWARSLNFYHS